MGCLYGWSWWLCWCGTCRDGLLSPLSVSVLAVQLKYMCILSVRPGFVSSDGCWINSTCLSIQQCPRVTHLPLQIFGNTPLLLDDHEGGRGAWDVERVWSNHRCVGVLVSKHDVIVVRGFFKRERGEELGWRVKVVRRFEVCSAWSLHRC